MLGLGGGSQAASSFRTGNADPGSTLYLTRWPPGEFSGNLVKKNHQNLLGGGLHFVRWAAKGPSVHLSHFHSFLLLFNLSHISHIHLGE